MPVTPSGMSGSTSIMCRRLDLSQCLVLGSATQACNLHLSSLLVVAIAARRRCWNGIVVATSVLSQPTTSLLGDQAPPLYSYVLWRCLSCVTCVSCEGR